MLTGGKATALLVVEWIQSSAYLLEFPCSDVEVRERNFDIYIMSFSFKFLFYFYFSWL